MQIEHTTVNRNRTQRYATFCEKVSGALVPFTATVPPTFQIGLDRVGWFIAAATTGAPTNRIASLLER